MEQIDKNINKQKLGMAILSVLEQNKNSKIKNRISSLRQLAAASGVEYSIIQKISSGKKDPQFTTLLAISEGLGMSVSILLSYFEKITDLAASKQINSKQRKNKKT